MKLHHMYQSVIRLIRLSLLFLCALGTLTGCTNKAVSVSIHGVNYTGEEFSYTVEDPSNRENRGGGETISPYGAGGTMCCYDLPGKWRPGLQVKVNLTRWLPEKPDGSTPEVNETHTTEVPPYADGKPGELWVLRNADGTVSVVSSNYQPDHEKWPGEVKGWPVPSLEYQRKRWDLYIEHAEGYVRLYQDMLSELEKSPDTRANDAWDYATKEAASYIEGMRTDANRFAKEKRDLIARFSGPADPNFRAWLKKDYEKSLEKSELELRKLKEARP
jgi:hypothetical protein